MPPAARIFEPNVKTSCHFVRLFEVRTWLSLSAMSGLILGLLCPIGLAAEEARPGEASYFPPRKTSDGDDRSWTESSSSNGVRQTAYQQELPPTPRATQPRRSAQTIEGTRELRQPEGFWELDSPESVDSAAPNEPSSSPDAGVSSDAASRRRPLPRMSRSGRSEGAQTDRPAGRVGGLASLLTIGGSLALVLGLFMVVAWIMRRSVPQASMPLPTEVVELLGRAPLAGRQQVHLLRCGKKLLLVSVTPDGAETLTEITEPEEVDRLAGICRQAHPASATGAFRQVFGQFATQPIEPALVDSASGKAPDPVPRRGSRSSGGKLERSDV